MPETNETYHPMTFDAIKIGLASPDKILEWSHGEKRLDPGPTGHLNLLTSPASSGENGGSRVPCATVCLSLQALPPESGESGGSTAL